MFAPIQASVVALEQRFRIAGNTGITKASFKDPLLQAKVFGGNGRKRAAVKSSDGERCDEDVSWTMVDVRLRCCVRIHVLV
jgi:hypothetical protein